MSNKINWPRTTESDGVESYIGVAVGVESGGVQFVIAAPDKMQLKRAIIEIGMKHLDPELNYPIAIRKPIQ